MTDSTAIAHVRAIFDDERMTSQLTTMLEGTAVTVAKFKSVALTAIVRDPELLEADRTSLLTACVDCARAGLLPDKKEAALVVHSTKKKVLDPAGGGRKEAWIKEVTYMPMIRGLYKLANSSGNVRRIRAHLVHAGDEFQFSYGATPVCEHRPALGGKPGLPTHAYAIAVLTDGTIDLEVMTIAEVNEVRRRSKLPKGTAWGSADMPHGEMAKKTVLHRICKRLDLSPDARDAVDRVEAEYDFDAPALPPSRPDRPTAGDDGLSMYDDIETDPKAPELAPIPNEKGPMAEKAARDAAMRGHESLNQHLVKMPAGQRDALQPIIPQLKELADEGDRRADQDGGAYRRATDLEPPLDEDAAWKERAARAATERTDK